MEPGTIRGKRRRELIPFELRARLGYDGKLLGAVSRIFVDTVIGFYRRRMRELGYGSGISGAVTVVQRTNADLRLIRTVRSPPWVDGVQ